jgi:glucosamine--fructose-6-phosphate aminotransferase (isomerizing)
MKTSTTSSFLKEIDGQPQALRELSAYYRKEGRSRLAQWAEYARAKGRVLFTGMGTSEFAPELVLTRLANAGVDATTLDAGELLHHPRPVPGLLVAISQSGESVETRQVAEAHRGRTKLVAVVNNEQSAMACAADLVLPMQAGHETAISTKTYVNTLALLHLLATAVENIGALDAALKQLEGVADAMPQCDRPGIDRAATLLSDTGAIQFITRGPALAAAKQAALTFMEGTRCSCQAFTGGAFRHGPFELAGPAHRAVFLIPEGSSGDLLAAMAVEVAGKGSRVVAIASRPVELPAAGCVVLRVPALGESLFPLAAATTQERLLDAVARCRGVEAGNFRYGGKITMRE